MKYRDRLEEREEMMRQRSKEHEVGAADETLPVDLVA